MPKRFLLILSMAAGLGVPHRASAYDECTFQSNTGRIANSYELIGVGASDPAAPSASVSNMFCGQMAWTKRDADLSEMGAGANVSTTRLALQVT